MRGGFERTDALNRRRVLFLTNIPAPYRVKFFDSLAELCDLTVVYERLQASDRDLRWKSSDSGSAQYRVVQLRGLSIGIDGALAPGVLRFLRSRDFDVIIVGTYASMTGLLSIAYMRLRGIPFALNTDGGFIKECSGLKFLAKRLIISSASWWLSASTSASKYLVHYGAKPEHIVEYPFTSVAQDQLAEAPASDAEKSAIRQLLRIPYQKVVLSIARHLPLKRLDLLVDAASSLPKGVGVYIVGGDPPAELRRHVVRAGASNVHFVDFQNEAGVIRYLRAADVFAMTSELDVYGLVIVEALAQGVPVVASSGALAAHDLIEPGFNGLVVPSGDVGALSDALSNLLTSGSLPEMRRNALATASKYTIERMANVHAQWIDSVVYSRG